MAATDSRPVPRKSAAFRVYGATFDTSGKLVTGGLTGTSCTISKDANSFGAPSGTGFGEIGTTGTWYVDLDATDMNADHVQVKFTCTNTNAVDVILNLYPEEVGDIRVNVTQLNSDSTLIAKFAAAVKANLTGTLTGTPTTTTLDTTSISLTQADILNGRVIQMLDGACSGGASHISDMSESGGTVTLTVEAFPTAPSSGDAFVIY